MQLICQSTQEAVAETNGEWEVAAITDIQFPLRDWAPVIGALQKMDAGAIIEVHWIAAQLAAFAWRYAFTNLSARNSSYCGLIRFITKERSLRKEGI